MKLKVSSVFTVNQLFEFTCKLIVSVIEIKFQETGAFLVKEVTT